MPCSFNQLSKSPSNLFPGSETHMFGIPAQQVHPYVKPHLTALLVGTPFASPKTMHTWNLVPAQIMLSIQNGLPSESLTLKTSTTTRSLNTYSYGIFTGRGRRRRCASVHASQGRKLRCPDRLWSSTNSLQESHQPHCCWMV